MPRRNSQDGAGRTIGTAGRVYNAATMRTGQSRRRDAIEPAIIQALKAIGVEVMQISGEGAPDLLCRRGGTVHAFEVKSQKGRLTEAQVDTRWPVIRSVAEALAVFGVRDR